MFSENIEKPSRSCPPDNHKGNAVGVASCSDPAIKVCSIRLPDI